jgi:hypothetical protein
MPESFNDLVLYRDTATSQWSIAYSSEEPRGSPTVSLTSSSMAGGVSEASVAYQPAPVAGPGLRATQPNGDHRNGDGSMPTSTFPAPPAMAGFGSSQFVVHKDMQSIDNSWSDILCRSLNSIQPQSGGYSQSQTLIPSDNATGPLPSAPVPNETIRFYHKDQPYYE